MSVDLAALVAGQAGVIAEQAATIAVLRAEVAELRRRLGLTSTTSARPPSSDGLGKPPPRSLRERSGRRPGKQPGAAGAALRQVDTPDLVVEHRPGRCGGCVGDLAAAPVVGVLRRQVFDLPEVRLTSVEHRMLTCRCRCGTSTSAAAPAGVNAPAQYGPGVAAAGVWLLVGQHLPVARAAQVLGVLVGAPVSTGWLAGLTATCAAGLAAFAERVAAAVRGAAVVHFDETGLRAAGCLRWLHVACTPWLTVYHLDEHRGRAAINTMNILPALTAAQVAVHDGWSPYLAVDYQQTGHAMCNAHHLRELDGWAAHQPDRCAWAATLAQVLRDAWHAVKTARTAGHQHLDPNLLASLHDRWQAGIDAAYQAYPPVKGIRHPVRALINRMRGLTTEIWHFTHNFTVPFDNNQAERDIRMTKIQMKSPEPGAPPPAPTTGSASAATSPPPPNTARTP